MIFLLKAKISIILPLSIILENSLSIYKIAKEEIYSSFSLNTKYRKN